MVFGGEQRERLMQVCTNLRVAGAGLDGACNGHYLKAGAPPTQRDNGLGLRHNVTQK